MIRKDLCYGLAEALKRTYRENVEVKEQEDGLCLIISSGPVESIVYDQDGNATIHYRPKLVAAADAVAACEIYRGDLDLYMHYYAAGYRDGIREGKEDTMNWKQKLDERDWAMRMLFESGLAEEEEKAVEESAETAEEEPSQDD